LGYFPRKYIQGEFKKRFSESLNNYEDAARRLERYFDRVRVRHLLDISMQRRAWAYVSTDVKVFTYRLDVKAAKHFLSQSLPAQAGVTLSDLGKIEMAWPASLEEQSEPLNGQQVLQIWPSDTPLDIPQRWVWHIVPQGSEKTYTDRGRLHVVEAWVKRGL
jgi:hypothetical protein